VSSITLITTIYNRATYLARTIDSILAQTDPHFTLLLWDDGSTDHSPQIAQQYANQDPRIQLIRATHQGAAPALRAAIAHTQSAYIACIDSDDLLASTALAETRPILDQNPAIGMVFTNYQLIDPQGTPQGLGQRCQIPYSPTRLLTDFMTFHFRLIRRTAYDTAGGINPTFPAAIDYDLCLRLAEVTHIHHHPSTLYSYRIHPHSISTQKRQLQIDYAAEAIRQALVRRRLDDRYELIVQPPSQFILKPRHSPSANQEMDTTPHSSNPGDYTPHTTSTPPAAPASAATDNP
jgi:glycosyltransferase involved in cell wall biosynthesis